MEGEAEMKHPRQQYSLRKVWQSCGEVLPTKWMDKGAICLPGPGRPQYLLHPIIRESNQQVVWPGHKCTGGWISMHSSWPSSVRGGLTAAADGMRERCKRDVFLKCFEP